MKARLIAHYLPQFHPILENNVWWGEGFTEWTNTAKAKPLFPGHTQPIYPAELGYYDLRVAETRVAQAELAKEHGIEGFCYWHYWFGGGKRLLERIFQEVVKSGEPDFPFCLAWANHTWSGIWHGAPDRILVQQTYPGINDFKAHFYCLLDAFKDDRYIKIEGRNVFCIYRPMDFKQAKIFISTWRDLAKLEGAPDFFFIGITDFPWRTYDDDGYDGYTTNPPVGQLPYQNIKPANDDLVAKWSKSNAFHVTDLPKLYRYETFIENAFPPATRTDKFYPCVMPNWDNTPRSGKNGFVLLDSTPDLWLRHLRDAIRLLKGRQKDHRLIFVKSWNEWAEGNILEPDQRWGKQYLLQVLKCLKEN